MNMAVGNFKSSNDEANSTALIEFFLRQTYSFSDNHQVA